MLSSYEMARLNNIRENENMLRKLNLLPDTTTTKTICKKSYSKKLFVKTRSSLRIKGVCLSQEASCGAVLKRCSNTIKKQKHVKSNACTVEPSVIPTEFWDKYFADDQRSHSATGWKFIHVTKSGNYQVQYNSSIGLVHQGIYLHIDCAVFAVSLCRSSDTIARHPNAARRFIEKLSLHVCA